MDRTRVPCSSSAYEGLKDDYQENLSDISRSHHRLAKDGDIEMLDKYSADVDANGGDIDHVRTIPSTEADLRNRATWLSCYINLTSTILGAGMLGLPYAYAIWVGSLARC